MRKHGLKSLRAADKRKQEEVEAWVEEQEGLQHSRMVATEKRVDPG